MMKYSNNNVQKVFTKRICNNLKTSKYQRKIQYMPSKLLNLQDNSLQNITF